MAQFAFLAAAAALAGAAPARVPDPSPEAAAPQAPDRDIEVRGERLPGATLTRSTLPLIDVPQSVTVIPAETFLEQGAISIADTVRYAAGAQGNTARDQRFDQVRVRGVEPSLLRDGMRDGYGYFTGLTPDPYAFSQVELLRGPASMLFGRGAIGGVVNMVSKTPQFRDGAELLWTSGSYRRGELLADAETVLGDSLGARLVLRARAADTFVPHVPDDRVLIAPSLSWRYDRGGEITLLASVQHDRAGSIPNFLPVIGTLRSNRGRAPLPRFLFLGTPGDDRYAGHARQIGGIATQRLGAGQVSLRARYTSGDVEYRSHYPDGYHRPIDPYVPGSDGRQITLSSYGANGGLRVFSADASTRWRVDWGAVSQRLLAGVDHAWHRAYRRFGLDGQMIDLYAVDLAAIRPAPRVRPRHQREEDRQLGLYAQDELRLWDRVSLVLGARHDRVTTAAAPIGRDLASAAMARDRVDRASTLRLGASADMGAGVTPYLSYNESFEPVTGTTADGRPFRPVTGQQHEAGVRWGPDAATLITLATFRIAERNRPVPDPLHPNEQIQAGVMRVHGGEIEAHRTLPDDYEVTLGYGVNHLTGREAAYDANAQHLASAWLTKTLALGSARWRIGGGVHRVGAQVSTNAWWTLVTPPVTLVDALSDYRAGRWRVTVTATNLLDRGGFSNCLARGDCFNVAPRNVMVSLGATL